MTVSSQPVPRPAGRSDHRGTIGLKAQKESMEMLTFKIGADTIKVENDSDASTALRRMLPELEAVSTRRSKRNPLGFPSAPNVGKVGLDAYADAIDDARRYVKHVRTIEKRLRDLYASYPGASLPRVDNPKMSENARTLADALTRPEAILAKIAGITG